MDRDRQAAELRRVLDIGLNYATLLGFAIPEVGVPISIGAGLARTLVGLFYPDKTPSEVETLVSTAKEVVDAVERMGVRLEKTVWSGLRDEHLAELGAIADVNATLTAAMLDGTWTAADLPDVVQQDWQRQFDKVFKECGAESRLKASLSWITLPQNERFAHQLTPLYLTTSSLYLDVCKLGLIIERVTIARDRHAQREAWRKRHPDGQGGPEDPEPEETLVTDDTLKACATWRDLTTRLERAVVEGGAMVAAVEQAFAAAEKAVAEREGQFTLQVGTGPLADLKRRETGQDPWCYVDAGTGYTSVMVETRDAAQLAMLVAQGQAVTEEREKQRKEQRLEGIDADVVKGMRELHDALVAACDDYDVEPDPSGDAKPG